MLNPPHWHKSYTLLGAFKEQIFKQIGSTDGKTFLIAISGGMDSTLLAQLCYMSKLDFALCHVNFMLRGEDSIGDEKFVKDLAIKLGVKAHIKVADLSQHKGNIQLEARRIRYAYFEELISSHGFDHLLTAHHLDDVAETFLFNLGRGTGIEGLMSIPAVNGKILRPLLGFSKEKLAAYATSKDLDFREDSSNATDKYARNYLRHQVIPKLKEQNHHFLTGLKKSIEHLKGVDYFAKLGMQSVLNNAKIIENENRMVYNADVFIQSSQAQTLAYHWLHPYGFSTGQIFNFFETTTWTNGAQIQAKPWQLTYDRGTFILLKIKHKTASRIVFNPKTISKISFNGYEFTFKYLNSVVEKSPSAMVAYFKAKQIENLELRYWQEGERFCPSGMKGRSKKVKRYFSDEKFANDQKADTPILSSKGDIMWIVGHRTDFRFAAAENEIGIWEVSASVEG